MPFIAEIRAHLECLFTQTRYRTAGACSRCALRHEEMLFFNSRKGKLTSSTPKSEWSMINGKKGAGESIPYPVIFSR